jgi:predicted dehydrogenase
MSGKLGAAVIGLRMGSGYVKAFLENPETELLAICDLSEDQMAEVSKKYSLPDTVIRTTDYRSLLSIKEIDVVGVVTPDFCHAEQSIAFLEKGKDVICDKPLALDMAEIHDIIKAVEKTGRKFMVGQVCRYAPGFVLAKQMVERGEIGELFLVESEYAHSYKKARGANDWRVDPRREPMIGGGCHAVDLLRWIAGEIDEVFGYANHKCLPDWPVNDCTVSAVRFKSGVIGRVMVSIGCVRPYTMRSVFYGTEGTIVCDNTSDTIQLCSAKNLQDSPRFAQFPVNIASHNVSAEVAEFVDCIVHNKPVVTTVYEGAKTVAACVAMAESARTGKPVRLGDLS